MPPFFINSIYIVYTFFLDFLSQGQLITGTSKAWLGQFGELGHPYTHPTSKQCNYSYSHPSTKQCDAAAGNHTHSDYLPYKGVFDGNIDDATIDIGIYQLNSYASGDNWPFGAAVYGTFIQYPGLYKTQVIIASSGATTMKSFTRRYLTSSSSWSDWAISGTTMLGLEYGGLNNDISDLPPYAILRATSDMTTYPYVNHITTANGALFATAENGQPKFGTLPIAQGGTGATTAAAARTALGAAATNHTHSGYATTAYVDSKVASVTEAVYGGSFTTNNGHTFVTFSSTYAKLKIVFYQYEHSSSGYTSLVDGTTRIIEKGGSINAIGFETNYGYSYMTIDFNGTKLTASSSGGGYTITYSLGIIAYTS